MSGGSLDYVYRFVRDAADSIRADCCRVPDDVDGHPMDPNRKRRLLAFASHLELVASALHDVEWVMSGDTSPGDELAAIDAALSHGAGEAKP